jgi:hypothetical protein
MSKLQADRWLLSDDDLIEPRHCAARNKWNLFWEIQPGHHLGFDGDYRGPKRFNPKADLEFERGKGLAQHVRVFSTFIAVVINKERDSSTSHQLAAIWPSGIYTEDICLLGAGAMSIQAPTSTSLVRWFLAQSLPNWGRLTGCGRQGELTLHLIPIGSPVDLLGIFLISGFCGFASQSFMPYDPFRTTEAIFTARMDLEARGIEVYRTVTRGFPSSLANLAECKQNNRGPVPTRKVSAK